MSGTAPVDIPTDELRGEIIFTPFHILARLSMKRVDRRRRRHPAFEEPTMSSHESAAASRPSLWSQRGNATVTILVSLLSVVGVGVVAKIAAPSLMGAGSKGNEASAIGSLRTINTAEASFASNCASGGFAISLEDLSKPPAGSNTGFVGVDLGSNGIKKSGYLVTVEKDATPGVGDMGAAASTCNGSGGTPASSYFASAQPEVPGTSGTRYYATDSRGIIFASESPITNPIVPSDSVAPVQ